MNMNLKKRFNGVDKMKIEFEEKEVAEAIRRSVKKFGMSGHIIVPKKHIDKEAVVFIIEKEQEQNKGFNFEVKELIE